MQQIKDLFSFGFWNFVKETFTYALIATPFFLVFWVFLKSKLKHRRIQEKQRSTPKLIRHEIKYSFTSLLIFSTINVCIYAAHKNGFTKIYDNVIDYGWGYLAFSIVLMIFLHDTWFYFTHRLMHHPLLFKYVHKVHHQSVDPSPFAAFSFHPLEALVEAGAFIIFAFLFPVHIIAFLVWQIIQLTLNVIGHLGYEIYPKGFNRHWLFRWKTPSTHHNLHHAKFKGNYGLYFTWWDRCFKTEFQDYHQSYEKVQNRILNKGLKTMIVLLFVNVSVFAQNQITLKWLSESKDGILRIIAQK